MRIQQIRGRLMIVTAFTSFVSIRVIRGPSFFCPRITRMNANRNPFRGESHSVQAGLPNSEFRIAQSSGRATWGLITKWGMHPSRTCVPRTAIGTKISRTVGLAMPNREWNVHNRVRTAGGTDERIWIHIHFRDSRAVYFLPANHANRHQSGGHCRRARSDSVRLPFADWTTDVTDGHGCPLPTRPHPRGLVRSANERPSTKIRYRLVVRNSTHSHPKRQRGMSAEEEIFLR